MGFFFNYKHIKPIKEAEIDGQPAEEEQTPDYSAEDQQQEQPENPAPQDTGAEGENEPVNPEEGQGEEQPVDYTQMDEDQGNQPPEGNPPPAAQGGEAAPSEVDELKQKEEDIYENLTPEQLDIKHKELKNRYLEMFDTTVSIIDRIGDLAVAEENLEIVKYVSSKLSELKEMLTDYINSVYQTKSYIENFINYNKFLAVLNGIDKILEEMNKKGQ